MFQKFQIKSQKHNHLSCYIHIVAYRIFVISHPLERTPTNIHNKSVSNIFAAPTGL